jgi:hypothetical protein
MLVVLTTAAFQQRPAPAQAEITVERINIVDQNGTLRMVISNKDRMHPGVMDGKTIDRPRPYAGVIFFNDEGDEVGGITYAGQVSGSLRTASAGITFDQLKQDQTIGLHYGEANGQRSAALEVWDRSDTPLSQLIEQLNNANSIQDATARDAAIARARAAAPPAPRRLFVGKTLDRAAEVSLADGNGQARLNLTVDATGNPRIEFLDAQGKVVSRIPAK